MRRILIASFVAVVVSAPLTAQGPAQFQNLFNGKDLAGWKNINGEPDTWAWRDGMVVTTGQPIGVMCSAATPLRFARPRPPTPIMAMRSLSPGWARRMAGPAAHAAAAAVPADLMKVRRVCRLVLAMACKIRLPPGERNWRRPGSGLGVRDSGFGVGDWGVVTRDTEDQRPPARGPVGRTA